MPYIRLFLLTILTAIISFASTTTVTGYIVSPLGDPLTGNCTLQAIGPWTTNDTTWRVVGPPTAFKFTAGVFSIVTVPTDSATPSGQYYRINCYVPRQTNADHSVAAYSWSRFWLVPVSGSPVDISSVEIDAMPVGGSVTFGPRGLTGATGPTGPAGGGGAWGGIGGTLSAQTDLAAALALKASTTHATTHKNGGTDRVSTVTAAANAIPQANSSGYLDTDWFGPFLVLKSVPNLFTATQGFAPSATDPGIQIACLALPSAPAAGAVACDSADGNKLKSWNGSTWLTAGSTATGLGDPGSNCVVQRNAAGTSICATGAGVIAAFTGTPTGAKFARDDGTLAVPPGNIGITLLTGDATTAAGGGSQALTLATVNSNVGACGDATHTGVATFDAKGRSTGCTAVLITGTSPLCSSLITVASNTITTPPPCTAKTGPSSAPTPSPAANTLFTLGAGTGGVWVYYDLGVWSYGHTLSGGSLACGAGGHCVPSFSWPPTNTAQWIAYIPVTAGVPGTLVQKDANTNQVAIVSTGLKQTLGAGGETLLVNDGSETGVATTATTAETLVSTVCGGTRAYTSTSAITVTIPAPGTAGFAAGCKYTLLKNSGTSSITLSGTIAPSVCATVGPNASVELTTDGTTTWYCKPGNGVAGVTSFVGATGSPRTGAITLIGTDLPRVDLALNAPGGVTGTLDNANITNDLQGKTLKWPLEHFAVLGTCNSGSEGRTRYIDDSNTATYGATVAGGGAFHVLVFCNATNWRVML
jgi:hypothetical protein